MLDRPPLPEEVEGTFWTLPVEAQVSEIFRLVIELEIDSDEATELLNHLQLIPPTIEKYLVSNVVHRLQYGFSEGETLDSLRRLGVKV
jgi:hypothetical protein